MKNYLKILALLLIFTYSCNKDEPEEDVVPEVNINCTDFSLAISTNDATKVEAQLNAFFNSRVPVITTPDPWGYEIHFNTLADQIKNCTSLTLLYKSYAGLQTAPPIATLGVKYISNGQQKNMSIYLYHTERTGGGKFLFREMNNY